MARTKQTARNNTAPVTSPVAKSLGPLPPNTEALLRTGPEAVEYCIPTAPPTPSNPLPKTTISLPRYSKWTSGLHFHATHTEYLHLARGCIFVQLNDSFKIYSAKAGGQVHWVTGELVKEGLVVQVPKYARHNWGRADEHAWGGARRVFTSPPRKFTRPEDVGEEAVVEEWTDPVDIGKALFFWNLNGVINAAGDAPTGAFQRLAKSVLAGWWIPFQLFVIFWELDNWPVFYDLGYQGSPGFGRGLWLRVHRWTEHVTTFAVLFAAKVLAWVVGVRAVEQSRTPNSLWKAYQHRGV